MTVENFPDCYAFTLQQEGGYSDDPTDPGNWTGCAPNVGQLKGTMKGISACAYPQLDIASLTDDDIQDIYHRDYWDKVAGDDLPVGVDLCTWDSAVNCGPGNGVKWLQRATGNPHADGAMGPETLSYVDKATDTDAVVDSICDQRMAYYKSLSTWPTYGVGWSNRVDAMRSLAHQMIADAQPTPTTPSEQVVTITITLKLPAGATVAIT